MRLTPLPDKPAPPASGSPSLRTPVSDRRDTNARRAQSELFDRLKVLQEKWRMVLGIVVPVYTLVRIAALGRGERSVMLEIVRRQGISGIAEAALTSVLRELAGVAMLGLLLFLGWYLFTKRGGWPKRVTVFVSAVLGAVLLASVIPWTMAAAVVFIAVLVLVTTLGFDDTSLPHGITVVGAVAMTLVVSPIFSAPWMPREKLEWGSQKEASGYVLGDGQGFLSLLDASDHKVRLIKTDDLKFRRVCRHGAWLAFDAPSPAEMVWGRTESCGEVPAVDEVPGTVVLCVRDDGSVTRLVGTSADCEPGTIPAPVGPHGPVGPKGPHGPIGRNRHCGGEGKARCGDNGEPAPHSLAWALVGADGALLGSSAPASARSDPTAPGVHIVRFKELNVTPCAAVAQAVSDSLSGSTLLMTVVRPNDASAPPVNADPAAGDVVVETTAFGKEGTVGFHVMVACPG